jgi:gamma-glutamyl-gamma-aminobutyrate hydrolase PuuD
MSKKNRFPPLRSFVIGGNLAIDRIFAQQGFVQANGLNDADIIVFQGGEDVSPYFYGDDRHDQTHSSSRRDQFEFACYKATKGKYRVGICRGGQFLNVMNGGWMWQHVDGHAGKPHTLRYTYPEKEAFVTRYCQNITSTHHQLIVPNKKTASIWGTASQTTRREGGGGVAMNMHGDHNSDVEICFYPNTRSLCFQPHPEYNSQETRELFFDCIERMLAV